MKSLLLFFFLLAPTLGIANQVENKTIINKTEKKFVEVPRKHRLIAGLAAAQSLILGSICTLGTIGCFGAAINCLHKLLAEPQNKINSENKNQLSKNQLKGLALGALLCTGMGGFLTWNLGKTIPTYFKIAYSDKIELSPYEIQKMQTDLVKRENGNSWDSINLGFENLPHKEV